MIYTVTLNPTIDRTIHFPQLKVGELNRASCSRTDLSGKGVNVSVALQRLGIESVMLGFVAGVYGQVLEQGLGAQGYRYDFLHVPGETRSNITVIDQARGVTTKLNEAGPLIRTKDLAALERRILDRIQVGDTCIFSGGLPPGLPADTYGRLIALAKERGAITVLDTSGAALAEGCRAGPDFVKPNDVEAAALVGMPFDTREDWIEGTAAIRGLGPQHVLLSLGSRGTVLATDAAVWLAEPPVIKEVSAVGAGDASMAAGLWAWMRHLAAEEIVRWATAAGTATAMEDGTEIPTLDKIEEVYESITAARLA